MKQHELLRSTIEAVIIRIFHNSKVISLTGDDLLVCHQITYWIFPLQKILVINTVTRTNSATPIDLQTLLVPWFCLFFTFIYILYVFQTHASHTPFNSFAGMGTYTYPLFVNFFAVKSYSVNSRGI